MRLGWISEVQQFLVYISLIHVEIVGLSEARQYIFTCHLEQGQCPTISFKV